MILSQIISTNKLISDKTYLVGSVLCIDGGISICNIDDGGHYQKPPRFIFRHHFSKNYITKNYILIIIFYNILIKNFYPPSHIYKHITSSKKFTTSKITFYFTYNTLFKIKLFTIFSSIFNSYFIITS